MLLKRFGLQCHLRRLCTSSKLSRQKLVILGTGWGSYSVLKNIDRKLYDVVVVSPRNHFLFTPLLCSTTVGTLEFRSIIEPIRHSLHGQEKNYHCAKAISLDTNKQMLRCTNILHPEQSEYDLHYDKLVIGVGATSNTFNVPGVKEYAFFLKDISDARKIRNKLLSNFDLALSPLTSEEDRKRYDHIVIVGGGPTGVEFGAELYDFLEQDLRKLYPKSKEAARVTLVEAKNILASFDDKLRQYAEKKINQREQFSIMRDSVAEVRSDGVLLRSGVFLPCGLVVWSAGVAPTDFVSQLPFAKNVIGQILTDRHLKVAGLDSQNVYALGDCADIDGHSLPCTGQVAEREGRYLANQLNGKDSAPFEYQGLGMLAFIGDFKAVSDLAAFKDSGFTSFLLWRSVYLTRLGNWKLRMQVPIDWFKTFVFGRDTSRFE